MTAAARRRAALPPRHLAPALACVAALALAACVKPVRVAYEAKRVAAKEGDATLVAADGTRCMVPPATFDATRVGDERACAWRNR